MPNLADLREERNKLMADAIALKDSDVTKPETRSQFDAIMKDVETKDEDIKRLETIENFEKEQRSRNPHRGAPGQTETEVRNREVRSSFVNYMRTGQIESRDLTTANQGILVPTLFDPNIVSAKASYGEIYNAVTVLKTDNGEPMTVPMDNDTGNGMVPVTVGTAVGEVDPANITGKTLAVGNYSTGIVRVDNGLLTDAGFDVESWIRDKFSLRFYRGFSSAIWNGNNVSVQSLAAGYAGVGVTTAATGKITYNDLVALFTSLDPAYQSNACWALSNATLGYVLGITDNNGRPIFLPDYGAADKGFVGTILGKPVRIVTQAAAVASGNQPILFGDFKEGYTARQQGAGIGILRLNELFAAGFETGFVGFARVGGIVTDAGTHPVVALTVK